MQSKIDIKTVHMLAKGLSDSFYQTKDPLSTESMCQQILAAAQQGRYVILFQFPEALVQAMTIRNQGQVPDFDPAILDYYDKATQDLVVVFKDSPFTVSGMPDGSGFKISWSSASGVVAASAASESLFLK